MLRDDLVVNAAIAEEEKQGFDYGDDESDRAQHRCSRSALILPLYSGMSMEDQVKVFDPAPNSNTRKIIVSTNVAETSVTVEGIVYVVDSCLVKEKTHSPSQGNASTLTTRYCSKSSAEQRAGRAGRTRPGICIRLTQEAFFSSLPNNSLPEIQRTDLTDVVLLLLRIGGPGNGNVLEFPFVSPPSTEALSGALQSLIYLGAISPEEGELTADGRIMAELPVDAPSARMLLTAQRSLGCGVEAAALASLLQGSSSIWFRGAAGSSYATYNNAFLRTSGGSDHIAQLKALSEFMRTEEENRHSFCLDNSLHFVAICEAERAFGQLVGALKSKLGVATLSTSGLTTQSATTQIRKALFFGFFQQSAWRKGDSFMPVAAQSVDVVAAPEESDTGATTTMAQIERSSAAASTPARWVVYHSLEAVQVAHNQIVQKAGAAAPFCMRTVSAIEEAWLADLPSRAAGFFSPDEILDADLARELHRLRRF